MKKKLVAIITIILSLLMCASIFSGCNLITIDSQKDMGQKVAKININAKYDASTSIAKHFVGAEYGGEDEFIYKKDLIITYMNYSGYFQQQGVTDPSQVFGSILDSLVNQRIIIQVAKTAVKKDNGTIADGKWDAKDFFSEESEEYVDVKYNVIKSLDSLVGQFVETKTTKKDTVSVDERTAPTGATNAVREITKAEKLAYINKMMDENGKPTEEFKGKVGSDRMVAYFKALKALENNELLGDSQDKENIFTTYYYDYLLESNFETKIVAAYEKLLITNKIETEQAFNKLTYDIAKDIYQDTYKKQEDLYKEDEKAFKDAISNATKTAPIVYSNDTYTNNYGYVINLLIGADEELTTKLNEIDKKNMTKADYEARRNTLFEGIVLKDQRASWITSGYDCVFKPYDTDSNVGEIYFVNDYTFALDKLPFQGDVEWLNKGDYEQNLVQDANGKYFVEYLIDGKVDEAYKPEFKIVSIDEVVGLTNITDFINSFKNTDGIFTEEIAKELVYAFSTDPGSLSSVNGYVIKDKDDSSSFVVEFQKKGEEVIALEKGKMDCAVTDFGFHFMINNGMATKYETLDSYCEKADVAVMTKMTADKAGTMSLTEKYFDYLIANWATLKAEDKNTYLYSLISPYMGTILSDYETELQRVAGSSVEKFQEVYADLIGG